MCRPKRIGINTYIPINSTTVPTFYVLFWILICLILIDSVGNRFTAPVHPRLSIDFISRLLNSPPLPQISHYSQKTKELLKLQSPRWDYKTPMAPIPTQTNCTVTRFILIACAKSCMKAFRLIQVFVHTHSLYKVMSGHQSFSTPIRTSEMLL